MPLVSSTFGRRRVGLRSTKLLVASKKKLSGSQGSTKLAKLQNFHCFSTGSGDALAYFELLDFSEKARRDGTFITILENSSPKDSIG